MFVIMLEIENNNEITSMAIKKIAMKLAFNLIVKKNWILEKINQKTNKTMPKVTTYLSIVKSADLTDLKFDKENRLDN